MSKPRWEFRDISLGLQMLRSLLLGREHKLHNRFIPTISPRSIPTPDVPRTLDYKYANQWYMNRNSYDSVKPPVVAPVALGGMRADSVCFNCAPTPGTTWWWDGHCYYEPVHDHRPPIASCQPVPSACVVDPGSTTTSS